MGLYDRDYMRASHPYNCSCNRCRPRRKKKKTAPLDSGEKQPDKPKTKPKQKAPVPSAQDAPSAAPDNFEFKWHESWLVAFFSPARWLLFFMGVGLYYLAAWHHPEMVEFWPWAGEDIIAATKLEMILLGICLSLVGLFASNNWGRLTGVWIMFAVITLGSGIRHGYLHLERTGTIDQLTEGAVEFVDSITKSGGKVIESIREPDRKIVESIKDTGGRAVETARETARRIWHQKRLNLAGARGNTIFLNNNPDAKDPTWAQLVDFLKKDDTDQIPYDYNSFVCADFAHRLHDNAEKAGWRCYYVGVKLGPSPDRSSSEGHALNAFKTTDRGYVFIDCTGTTDREGPRSGDTTVKVIVGRNYVPESIFPEKGFSTTWGSMGKVLEIDLFED